MDYLHLSHLGMVCVYACLAALVLSKDMDSSLNRICSIHLLLLSLWSAGMMGMQDPENSLNRAQFYLDFSAPAWIFFSVTFLHFNMIFIGQPKPRMAKSLLGAAYACGVYFVVEQLLGRLSRIHPVRQSYGWAYEYLQTFPSRAFVAFYVLLLTISILSLTRYYFYTRDLIKKKIALVIIAGTVITAVLGTLTNVILPHESYFSFPPVANLVALFWAAALSVAMLKYRVMMISPEGAAENILQAMSDALFLLDADGRIMTVNHALLSMTGYKQNELIGQPHSKILTAESVVFEKLFNQDMTTYDCLVRTKSGRHVLVFLSSSIMKDRLGNRIGTVCAARDITDRKKAEQSLQSAKDYLHNIINAVADPIFVKDSNRCFVLVNDALCDFVGHPREALLGKNDYEFFPKDQADVFREKDELVLNTGKENINEETILDAQGVMHTIVTKKSRWIDKSGNRILVGIIRDITKRKEAEEALQESKDYLDKIINSIPDPVFVKDRQHRLILANDAELALAGCRREDLIGKTDYDFFPKDQVDVFWKKDEEVFKSGKENTNEETITDAHGLVRTILTKKTTFKDKRGNQYLVGIIRDISERKRAEEEIIRANQFTESTINALPDIFYVLDDQGRFVKVNNKFVSVTGYSQASVLKMSPFEVFSEEDRPVVEQKIKEVFDKGSAVMEVHLLGKDGAKIPYYVSGVRAVIEKETMLLCMGLDISERLKVEKALKNAYLELEKTHHKMVQTEKMAAVGQLAGGIAHEINNPLGVILGFSESLVSRLQPGDPNELPLKSIQREAVRCRSFVRDLLAFSRLERGAEELDLNQLLESSISLIVVQSKIKKVEFIKELSPDLPKITANANQIQQVVINLANNAMDAMPNGGKLIVRTKISSLNGQQAVEIQIEDTGTGIPPETVSRIFDPFFTTKEVGKGTGLGLSIVYEIVQKHAGEIQVRSDIGKGTVFTIRLPYIR